MEWNHVPPLTSDAGHDGDRDVTTLFTNVGAVIHPAQNADIVSNVYQITQPPPRKGARPPQWIERPDPVGAWHEGLGRAGDGEA